ncbi:MAG TPA: S-layer homology domain-containing protein [Syntrophomonadaceae bacterium]|nr:S-layer homology domain-containing protein [Syntrophomonadaceae bacterium]
MKQKIIGIVLAVTLIFSFIPVVMAANTLPSSYGAPKDFSIHYREDGMDSSWAGFDANVSASDELRSYVDIVGADDSVFSSGEYTFSDILLQLDYKVDSGSWHYKSQWDEDPGYNTNKSLVRIEKGTYSNSVVFDKSQFESISPGETLPADKSYFDTHSMDFRARYIVSYQDSNGQFYQYFSPWSQSVSFSNNQQIEDPDKLINHIPGLKSADLKKDTDNKPYLDIVTDQAHEDLRLLNTISNNAVKTEVWLSVNNGEWKACHSDSFVEEFNIGSEAYFGLQDSYENAVYDIKFRYVFDYYNYPAAGKSGVIYSPFSNVVSHGMAAYSAASEWAKTVLDKANSYGLIPESLKGADMTKPITREEFAELVVKLYEKTTGKTSSPASPNPFTDTNNPEILKAFKLGITAGTSTTTFAPRELTNREEVATMLSHAIRVIVPDADFSTTGAPVFKDQKDISSWALEHVLFMSKAGIINGADGKFMPKALTTEEEAAEYGTTTREQALVMSASSFEKFK